MKCLALGLSAATIVFVGASVGAAPNAAPSPAPTETTTPVQTTSADAPAPPTITSPNAVLPNQATPNQAAPNQTAPNQATPNQTAPKQVAPSPVAAPPQVPYPSYGYPNPYAGYGWGIPPKPPEELPYDGGVVPYGYKVEERYNLGLLIAGPTLLGLAYLLTAYSANEKPGLGVGSGFVNGSQWDALYIPVAGPFVFSAYAPEGSGFIYVFEGLAQVTGVGLFLGSILRPKEILVRKGVNEAFRPALQVGPGHVQLEMRF